MDRSHSLDPLAAQLEEWPLDPEQVVSGDPRVSGLVLDDRGGVQRGLWQHTPGVSRDVEADELFVVLAGRATIEVAGGPTLDVGPGDVGILRAGDRTLWTVHETLRKVFQVTGTADAPVH